MRATTRSTPNVSRATRAEMMLELSPLETAANASARSMPGLDQHLPVEADAGDLLAGEVGGRAGGTPARSWSITATEWPSRSRPAAREEPTRPQPMITTCTRGTPSPRVRRGERYRVRRAPPRDRTTLSAVSKLRTALKRLLVGRPFRSDRLAHTLLPKRIALPVFASDALSSVAYAPEEILLTLSVAGRRGVRVLAVGRPRGRGRAAHGGRELPAERARLPVRRRRLRGRHGQPRAAAPGSTVASALLVDYMLTVAVSISSAAANIGALVPFVGRAQGARSRSARSCCSPR